MRTPRARPRPRNLTHVDDPKAVGRRIRELRLELGLSQRDLGDVPGLLSYGYLSRIEAGERCPSVQVIRQIAARLGVQAETISHGTRAEHVPMALVLRALQRHAALLPEQPDEHLMDALERLGGLLDLSCTGHVVAGRIEHADDTCPTHEWLIAKDAKDAPPLDWQRGRPLAQDDDEAA